jgi:antitoxin component of RelBE/YafQ-DinJ toxin-antitoxin module
VADQPRKDNPARGIRIPDDLWTRAKARADERGETVSEAVRKFLERYVR